MLPFVIGIDGGIERPKQNDPVNRFAGPELSA